MKRTLEHYKEDIIEASKKITDFISNQTEESFLKNNLVFSAVLMQIVIIGEATSKFPKEIRKQYPDVPWRDIVAIRNFLAHEYYVADPKIIWETVKVHIPIFIARLDLMNLGMIEIEED